MAGITKGQMREWFGDNLSMNLEMALKKVRPHPGLRPMKPGNIQHSTFNAQD
jgi:hypothetical protein